jgi:hypothetical protein
MDPTRPQSTYGQSPSNVSVNQRDRSGMAPGYNSNYAQSPAALAGMSREDEEEMNRQQQAAQAAQVAAKGGRRRRRTKRSRKSRRTRRR